MPEIFSGPVSYTKTITDAWKALWKGWALWGVVATGWLTIAGLTAVLFGAGWAIGAFEVSMDDPESLLVMMAVLYGAFGLVGLVSALFYPIIHGGAVYAADELLSGRKLRYAQAMGYGFRRWPTTFGFHFLYFATLVLLSLGLATLFVLVVAALTSATGDAGGIFVLCGVCCGYAVVLIGTPLVSTIVVTLEAVGIRTALLTEAGAFGAYRMLWRRLRVSIKPLFVMGLAFLALSMVYQMITSAITSPITFVFMGDYYTALFEMMRSPQSADPEVMVESMYSSMGGLYTVLPVLSAALAWPFMTFVYPLMGSFYRQLTGIEPPPVQSQPTYAAGAPGSIQVPPERYPPPDPGDEGRESSVGPSSPGYEADDTRGGDEAGSAGPLPPTPGPVPHPPPAAPAEPSHDPQMGDDEHDDFFHT